MRHPVGLDRATVATYTLPFGTDCRYDKVPHPKIRSGATASVLYFAITYQPDGEAVPSC